MIAQQMHMNCNNTDDRFMGECLPTNNQHIVRHRLEQRHNSNNKAYKASQLAKYIIYFQTILNMPCIFGIIIHCGLKPRPTYEEFISCFEAPLHGQQH